MNKVQENKTTIGHRLLGLLGGLIFGFLIGFVLGALILKITGYRGTYDGFLIIYTAWGGIILGGIIGLFSPQFIAKTIGVTTVMAIIVSIPAYLYFLVTIKNIRNIDKDQFSVKGDLALLKKVQVNVRYKISENENPVYSIFYHTRNYLYEESNKNNIQAQQYEFFINYDNSLFTNFIKNDSQNCQNQSLLSYLGLASSSTSSKCWDENFLYFIQDKDDVYVSCMNIKDKKCIKLMPLKNTVKIPIEYTEWNGIGRGEIHQNREARSFWHFIIKFLLG